MDIKQGANNANVVCHITGTPTSRIGRVVVSIITLWSTRSVVVWVSMSFILVLWSRVVIVIIPIQIIITVSIEWGSVPVIAPAYLVLGIMTPTSLIWWRLLLSDNVYRFR